MSPHFARLNVPVIPMRIDGLWDLKRAGKQSALPGTIRVTIGEPVKFDPATEPEAIVRELQKKVEELKD